MSGKIAQIRKNGEEIFRCIELLNQVSKQGFVVPESLNSDYFAIKETLKTLVYNAEQIKKKGFYSLYLIRDIDHKPVDTDFLEELKPLNKRKKH